MKIEHIREMKAEEIRKEIDSAQKELMNMRMSNRIGTLENPVQIRAQRRTIARMKTVLKQKNASAVS
jgi:large subunit ribosomal protein L29